MKFKNHSNKANCIDMSFHSLSFIFLVADERLYKRLCPLVCWSIGQHESKSGKTSISAPALPAATDISRVSGFVFHSLVEAEGGVLQFLGG